ADEANTVKLGMAKRKNLYLVYKEAINNAAKYADGKNIWITLTYKKPMIRLTVKDDGLGFILEDEPSGNGLLNMRKRAAQLSGQFSIITAPGEGTLVQLSFDV